MASSASGPSNKAVLILSQAFEVSRRELVRDAQTIWRCQGPGDDLVVHLSRTHGWAAELSVSYLSALRRAFE
jgi:hypothetical protein